MIPYYYSLFTIDNPFGCSPQQFETDLQNKITQYYNTVNSDLMKYIYNAYSNEIFGKESNSNFNKVMDIHYLLTLLISIYYHQKNHYNNTGVLIDIEDYFDYYNIPCMIKYFRCNNIDINPLLSIFGLKIPTSIDGIDNMVIPPNSSTYFPDNIVQ